jgi:hypothetical protein
MKARSKELLERAISAMVAAIEIYNKPQFPYRAESFTVLATNAWELLLKAKKLTDNKNKLSSLYVREGKGAKRRCFKKSRAGNPLTHSLQFLADQMRQKNELDRNIFRNLELLTDIRDTSVHFLHTNPQFEEHLQEIALAAVKNFHAVARDWFNEDLSRFSFCLLPLSFLTSSVSFEAVLNQAEKRFIDFLHKQVPQESDPSSQYSVAINVDLRFVRSKSQDALPVRITTDANALEVRLTEEQIREKYPWDYKELTARCKARYSDFKENRKYHKLRQELTGDLRYGHIRQLDPGNPKSQRKGFFNPNILQELDNHYQRRESDGQNNA